VAVVVEVQELGAPEAHFRNALVADSFLLVFRPVLTLAAEVSLAVRRQQVMGNALETVLEHQACQHRAPRHSKVKPATLSQ
jgi:hypothetical protein